ncbi:MAG: regulatory protein RecX [Bacteriovoracaceae bacterium]|nr:regulatory protein RecX [Bacteriovoracaceae bacterium]
MQTTEDKTKLAIEYGLRLLGMRDYSRSKLKKKLISKEYESEVVEQALNRLEELKYLDDERYARYKIKSLILRGTSKNQIMYKLKFEGITLDDSFISEVFDEQNTNESEQIDVLLEKKIRNKTIPDDRLERRKFNDKLLRYLISKGHDFDSSIKAINSIKSE